MVHIQQLSRKIFGEQSPRELNRLVFFSATLVVLMANSQMNQGSMPVSQFLVSGTQLGMIQTLQSVKVKIKDFKNYPEPQFLIVS